MARRASSQFLGTFLLASALHEDPRFFVRNDLHFGGSVKYAIRRVFVTRTDSGDPVFNWSGLLGMAGAEGLANAYYPDSYRTAANTFSRFGFDMLGNAAATFCANTGPASTASFNWCHSNLRPLQHRTIHRRRFISDITTAM